MIYNTSYFIDGWNKATDTHVKIDIHFTITVEDGSFSHDWTPGAVEKATDYEIEEIMLGFNHRGKYIIFDPSSDVATCIAEWEESEFEAAKEAAIMEAIYAFENPEGTWDDIL